jgi:kinesin family protein 6/9
MKENQSTIQIFCRVRPLKKNSKLQYSQGRYWISKEDEGARIGFHIPKDQLQGLINHSRENFEFKFNHLFDTDTNQEEVFDIVAKPVISRYLSRLT